MTNSLSIRASEYEALVKTAVLVDLWLRTGSEETLEELRDAVLHWGGLEPDDRLARIANACREALKEER